MILTYKYSAIEMKIAVILIQISCDLLYVYNCTVFHFVGKINSLDG